MKVNVNREKFFPRIEYFWSLDYLNFSRLPVITLQEEKKLSQITEFFIGQHDRSIFKGEDVDTAGNI